MFADKLALGLQGLGILDPAISVAPVGPAWAVTPAVPLANNPGAGIDPNYIAWLAGSPGATPTPPTIPATMSDLVASSGTQTSNDEAVTNALNQLAAQGYTLTGNPAPLTSAEVAQAQANNLATTCTDSIGCFMLGSTQIPETPLLLFGAGVLAIMMISGGKRR